MFTKSALLTFALLGLAQSGLAKDLPDVAVTKNRASYVGIYDVLSAKVTKFKYTPGSPTTGADKMSGLLQIELSVEGNICGDNPSSLAVAMKYKSEGTEVALVTSAPYKPDPEVSNACLTYAKGSTVTVPIAIDDYIHAGRTGSPHKFLVELDQAGRKLVTATVNTATKTYDVSITDDSSGL
ncbi:MAG: hypothetical protein NTV34_03425 [Proteobacteria bacterium]|nr:hypothetical protein [Pseudomonadota bacterium]